MSLLCTICQRYVYMYVDWSVGSDLWICCDWVRHSRYLLLPHLVFLHWILDRLFNMLPQLLIRLGSSRVIRVPGYVSHIGFLMSGKLFTELLRAHHLE